jgi:hypothetical protein
MLSRKIVFCLAGSLGALLVASGAQAQFRMSGTLITSTGQSTTRQLDGAAFVSGSAGSLMIPAKAFQKSGFTLRTFLFSASIAQVASSFTSSNDVVTVGPGGGPGAFSWCPVGNMPCTDPDQFSSTQGFHGLLVYSDGSGYGGTFKVLRNTLGSLARRVTVGSYSHSNPGNNTNPWGGGLPFSSTQATVASGAKIVTSFGANGALGTQGSIQTIGTTLGQPGGGVGNLNQIGTSPATPTRFVTGFPATTGMIFALDRSGNLNTFTWTGSDNRNANGHGSITLVASGYSNNLQGEVFPHRLTVAMNIGPMVPTMGAAGIAALGILLLISGGYAMRRRF